MTVNKDLLDDMDLTKKEKDSVLKIIQSSYTESKDSSDKWLAVNFIKSLTNSNVKVNILKLLQKFDVEDLSNCMRVSKKIDIDVLIVEERCCY